MQPDFLKKSCLTSGLMGSTALGWQTGHQHGQFCIQREADVHQAQLLSLSASFDGWNTNGKLVIFKALTNCHSEPITSKADVGHRALDVTLPSEMLEFDSPGS